MNGSTDNYLINNARVSDMNSFSNLPAGHLFAQEAVEWSVARESGVGLSAPALMTLSCTDFAWTKENVSEGMSFSEFLPEEIIPSLKPKTETQKCRALYRQKNNTYLSPIFDLRMPAQNVAIEMSVVTNQGGSMVLKEQPFVQYKH